MSCPASDCLDSLAQMAPHIIIVDTIEHHPHRNLYHDMIVNEKQVVESRTKRFCHFTRDIATKAAHTLEACLVRQRAAAHKLQARLTGQNKPDVEKAEALLLLARAKTHKLAENYKANASSENLTKRKQSTSNASTLVNDEEPESGEIISIRASFANYSHPKAACQDESPAPKNGITVTTTPLPFPLPTNTSTTSVTTSTMTTSMNQQYPLYTKQYKKLSWSSGMEEYEQVSRTGSGKTVLLVWGKGIDEEREVECLGRKGKGKKLWGRMGRWGI